VTTETPGWELFARYAFPPNELGYCGPPDSSVLLHGGGHSEIARHAAGFDGAWPYLEEIAAAVGAAHPLETTVVRSYWIGGPQLAAVDGARLTHRLRAAFAGQPTGVLDSVHGGALANHSFHVFAVYPWVRFLDIDPATPLRILQACRIRWGTVVSVDDEHVVMTSRPLRFDGGAAIVVTSAERAATLRRPPVLVLGAGEAHSHRHITGMADLTRTAAAESGARAFAEAGLTPADVDCVQLYDAFTITPILFLEDLGFCAKGEGGPFVSGGRTAPGGALPMNTNGGGLSYCHPGMYGLLGIVEAVRQLRGEAAGRQVAGCEVAVVHGNGGVLSSQATLVLGTAGTA